MATIFEQLEEIFNEYDNKINELTKRVEQLENPSKLEQLEKSSKPPFKVGDKVRILVLNYVNEEPLYPIGTIGTIINIEDDGLYEIYSDEDTEHKYGWWYNEGDFELVEEKSKEKEESKFPKFKVGDKVRTLKEKNNGEFTELFPIGTVGVIEDIEIITDSDTTKQYHQYKVATDDDFWYYDEENIELVEEQNNEY